MDIGSIDVLSPQRQSLFSKLLTPSSSLHISKYYVCAAVSWVFLILEIIWLLLVMTDEDVTLSSPYHEPFPSFLYNYPAVFIL